MNPTQPYGTQIFEGKNKMKCVTCKQGDLHPGTTTFMADRSGTIFVVKGVPALICNNCHAAYFEGPIMDYLLQKAEQAVKAGIEVDIQKYAAA